MHTGKPLAYGQQKTESTGVPNVVIKTGVMKIARQDILDPNVLTVGEMGGFLNLIALI
jgi:hypothetical protein